MGLLYCLPFFFSLYIVNDCLCVTGIYEGRSESKECFAVQRYLLVIGKKQNTQVLSHTFTYFSTVTLDIEALAVL